VVDGVHHRDHREGRKGACGVKKIRSGVQSFDDVRRGLDHVNALTPSDLAAYTPILYGSTGGPNLGAAPTLVGRYSRNAAYCYYTFYIVLGVGASFAGCGTITMSAPLPMVTVVTGVGSAGSAYGVAGQAVYYAGTLWIAAGTSIINMICHITGVWSATVPAVWMAGDTIRGSILYPIY